MTWHERRYLTEAAYVILTSSGLFMVSQIRARHREMRARRRPRRPFDWKETCPELRNVHVRRISARR